MYAFELCATQIFPFSVSLSSTTRNKTCYTVAQMYTDKIKILYPFTQELPALLQRAAHLGRAPHGSSPPRPRRPGSLAGTGSGERPSRRGRGEARRARSVRSPPPPQPPTHMRGAWLKATPIPPVRRSIASCCRGEVRLQRCPVHPACKLQAYRLLLGGSRSGGSVGGIALPVVHLRGQRGALRRAEARATVGRQQWQAQCRRRLSPAPRKEAGPEQALSRP